MQFLRDAARLGRPMPLLLAAGLLAACSSTPNEMPAAAQAAQAAPADGAAEQPPMDVHEASAQCWMQADKTRTGIDARAKFVDKCIDDKMKKAGAR